MTEGQRRRSAFHLRSAGTIAEEARRSAAEGKNDRVVRKTHEALELWLKGLLLARGIDPVKSHDLRALAAVLPPGEVLVPVEDLEFLTGERIRSVYGAADFIPDEEYDADDAARCLAILAAARL
jgi:HEPN domain-containing protein